MKDQEKKRTIRTDVKIHKRTPQRPASRPSDIYISSKSKTNVVVKRVRQLMVNEHYSSVTLHGMGATVSKAISIAQAIQSALHDQVSLKPVTGTVKLIDDVIPENMVLDC
ncbi:hypothetical protein VTP01DRAFT_8256 [Rhizomucor pusillus]|uniref:uncharacterized protein n=1 Tax=Rhizomucor pusillus TaxID=4840 RepID=UPI003743A1AB